jgi:hypothetical protein
MQYTQVICAYMPNTSWQALSTMLCLSRIVRLRLNVDVLHIIATELACVSACLVHEMFIVPTNMLRNQRAGMLPNPM